MEYEEGITFSEDESIICVTTKNGISIYEAKKFRFISSIDSFPKNIEGKITNCKILFNTRILSLVLKKSKKIKFEIKFENNTEKKEEKKENKIEEKNKEENSIIDINSKEKKIEKEEEIKEAIINEEIFKENKDRKEEKNNGVIIEKKKEEKNIEKDSNIIINSNNKEDEEKILKDNKNKNTIIINYVNEINENDNKIIEERESLFFIDIDYNRIIGEIKLSEYLYDYLFTRNFIILSFPLSNKVVLFKTFSLNYFATIENVNLGIIKYNENYSKLEEKEILYKDYKKCILVYQDYIDQKKLILIEYLLDNDRQKILGKNLRQFTPEFYSNGIKFIHPIHNYLIISSNIGNKLHIYDINSFELLYCIFIGNFKYDFSGIGLSKDKEILSIITNNKYLKLFKLKNIIKKCTCEKNNDIKVSFKEQRSLYDKLKHKLNTGKTLCLCKYKINYSDIDQKENLSFVIFDKIIDEEIVYVVQKNGKIIKLGFLPDKSGKIKLIKVITLSKSNKVEIEEDKKKE